MTGDLSWLDAIEARLGSATMPPWERTMWSDNGEKPRRVIADHTRCYVITTEGMISNADAEFIANAPADIARLVKALRDAHAKLERVEALAADLESWPSPYRGMPVAAEAIRAALAGEDS